MYFVGRLLQMAPELPCEAGWPLPPWETPEIGKTDFCHGQLGDQAVFLGICGTTVPLLQGLKINPLNLPRFCGQLTISKSAWTGYHGPPGITGPWERAAGSSLITSGAPPYLILLSFARRPPGSGSPAPSGDGLDCRSLRCRRTPSSWLPAGSDTADGRPTRTSAS